VSIHHRLRADPATIPTLPSALVTAGSRMGESMTKLRAAIATKRRRLGLTAVFALTNTTTGGPSFSAADVDNGADSYGGWTDWSAPTGRTISAHSTVDRHYVSGKTTVNITVIWLHELGHGLGLAHVTPVARVMHNPASGAYNAGVRNLTSDEVAGIDKKYWKGRP
jgi:hypothetical protein